MSKALTERIAGQIGDSDGWISFEDFMRQALYAPGMGYYESGQVFGAQGDFITGVDAGPWLALGFADLIEWGWRQLDAPDAWSLIEQGAGEGRLLCDVVHLLSQRPMTMPSTIYAVERSAYMGQRQQQAYAELGLDVQILSALDEVQAQENVLFFCNELPDAFPVRCFSWRDGTMVERGVALAPDAQFIWQDAPKDRKADLPDIDRTFLEAWPDGYVSEWNPHLARWQSDVGRIMQRGLAFCIDYGYAQSEYYRPQRIEGTVLAHLKHEVVHDVLSDPGSRDITAHIDFTALGRAGRGAGLEMTCWMTQGAWLAQSPAVQQMIQQAVMQQNEQSVVLMAAAKRMLLPQGMGELFKLSIQAKGVQAAFPDYLTSFNRIDALALGDG